MKNIFKKILCVALALLVLGAGRTAFLPTAEAYEAPLKLPKLCGNVQLDMFAVAKSQVGYTEDVFGGSVYGEWWTEVTDIGYDCTRADWCAIFLCWCMDKAGVDYGIAYNKLSGSVDYLFSLCRVNGSKIYEAATGYTPKCGDLAFYSYNGGETLGHIAVTDGSNHYIHANYASAVVEREGNSVYKMSDGKYYHPLYYVTPAYEATVVNSSSKIVGAVMLATAMVLFTPGELEKMLKEKYADTGDPAAPPAVVTPPVTTRVRGDVDRDGFVTASDARLALRAAVKLDTLYGVALELGDLNGDGAITSDEARRILRAAVGMEIL